MSQRDKLILARQNMATKINKRLRKETRVTPWRDAWELESVGRGLLSVLQLPSSTIEQALDTVNIWRARSHALEAIPHAIEATAALAQIYWRDHIQGGASATELRLAYSSAVVRCINGFADALQQQRFLAAPVSILCGQLGIPSWLVDIRHEASHNALPTLPVLRLATTTLLEYLEKEYWIPTCPDWEGDCQENAASETLEKEMSTTRPVDILVQYKSCASRPPDLPEVEEDIPTVMNETGISKKLPKPTRNEPSTSKPFDTFFGDNDDDDGSDEEDDWEDSLLGGLQSSYFGSTINRFAALAPVKKSTVPSQPQPKKKKPKKPKKPPQRKKVLGEKYPTDHAKEFVETVSPQEGHDLAIRFLVWGGVAGAPIGRGVLIPGSLVAFPATPQGIRKSRERYLPLLEVLGRVWPGFLSALLIHLVDFVRSIEGRCAKEGSLDESSTRKLFFLSSWVHFLVSQEFVQKLYPEEREKGKKGTTTENSLASLEQLEPLYYPLNSLCDRCIVGVKQEEEFRTTSRNILQTFEEILSTRRVEFCGVGLDTTSVREIREQTIKDEPDTAMEPAGEIILRGPALSDGKMSLIEMEALLSTEPSSEADHPMRVVESVEASSKDGKHQRGGTPTKRPIAWTRCVSWDACAIGTMPGHPV